MQSTKEHILAHLKRTSGATVDALAAELGLARMTVRQHLAGLERDGLVVSHEERGRTGRPRYVFSLSDGGQEMFPKRYDRLADLVLQEIAFLDADEIAGLSPEDKKRLLMRKMAERVYQQYEPKVRDKALGERIPLVAGILQEEGGFAEWRRDAAGFEIVDYNCVYRKVADSHHDVCEWHLSLLGRLLDAPVECTEFQSKGSECCRFVVRNADANESEDR
jgi:predicted ArsR family transcriptional regulator